METLLTTQIKKATHSYAPKMSAMRTIRYADEITTPSGIVDSIRFEDIDIGNVECRNPNTCNWSDRKDNGCKSCMFRHHQVKTRMLITCFEVKISMSDFHSGHGSNFWGHMNYYCVPGEMAPLVAKELEFDSKVGILSWDGKHLRKYRPAQYVEVADGIQIMLLYNALKKWCDGVQKPD